MICRDFLDTCMHFLLNFMSLLLPDMFSSHLYTWLTSTHFSCLNSNACSSRTLPLIHSLNHTICSQIILYFFLNAYAQLITLWYLGIHYISPSKLQESRNLSFLVHCHIPASGIRKWSVNACRVNKTKTCF